MTTTTLPQKKRSWLDAALSIVDWPMVVLAGLAMVGLWAALYRIASGLGGATGLNDLSPWGIWIGFDFSLIALSGAGFTMAGIVYVFRREDLRPALRPAILTALLGYTGVLLLLVLDLGRPDRFYHFLIYWNLHSPLFEISWCVLLYTTVLMIEVSPLVFERLGKKRPIQVIHRIIVPVAILAVTLSTLHQSTLGTLYLDMPYRLNALWFTPLLPLLFYMSSIMSGLAMAVVGYEMACRVRKERPDFAVQRKLANVAGWIGVPYLIIKFGEQVIGGELPALLALNGLALRRWGELVVVALIIILLLAPTFRNSRRAMWAGLGLTLVGIVINRFNATIFAQPSAGAYTPHILEWLSTIGIVAGVMLLWLLGIKLLAVLERPHRRTQH